MEFLKEIIDQPRRLPKVACTIGEAILGADRWVRSRERLRSTILQKPQPIDPEIEQHFRRFYRDDILKPEGYIGRDLSSWIQREPK